MLAIIASHVALIALVMSAKMELPLTFHPTRTIVDLIHEDDPPPPNPIEQRVRPAPRPTNLTVPRPDVPLPVLDPPVVDAMPSLPNLDPRIDPNPGPAVEPVPTPASVRTGARLLTPAEELKPPYPSAKLASGEEAVLRLRLSIDERGRVVAVEPVGRADRTFLDAARRHLIAHWRYTPASEDGRAVTSSTVITLRFQLDA
jgi:protein TonB